VPNFVLVDVHQRDPIDVRAVVVRDRRVRLAVVDTLKRVDEREVSRVVEDEVAVVVGREALRRRADSLPPPLGGVLLAADGAPDGLLASAVVQQRDLFAEERRHRLLRVDYLDHVVEEVLRESAAKVD